MKLPDRALVGGFFMWVFGVIGFTAGLIWIISEPIIRK